MNEELELRIQNLIEAALFVVDKPLSIEQLQETVLIDFNLSKKAVRAQLEKLQEMYQNRGVILVEVASGFRFQSREDLSDHLSRLWTEKAPKYSRALLETLALIAYRQPITRGEIEEVRGVSVSSHIIRSLIERKWVKIVGHKEVPGRPALYATTREFLDYFSLQSLSELPELEEVTLTDLLMPEASQALDEESQELEVESNEQEELAIETLSEESSNTDASSETALHAVEAKE